MKRTMAIILALSIFAFFGYACEDDTSSGICTDSGGSVTSASDTKLYYPCNISSPTAATTISSGYTQTLGDIEWLSTRIAEQGYVVLGLTPSNTYGNVSQWKDMHKSGVSRLIAINSSHATLKGMIDTSKLQVSAHSKGGGGTLWAAADLTTGVRTAIPMAPYQEQFSNSTLSAITASTLIEAGGSDTLATNSMTVGEYNSLSGSISRAYFEYSGYDHLAWTTGGSSSERDRIAADYIAWMKYYLDGDTSYAGTLSNTSSTSVHEWVNLGAPDPEPEGDHATINGTYSIVAVHSGKALDVWEFGTVDGTNIAQYDFWGGESQQFNITPVSGIWHRITPVIATDQAVDVSGCVTDPGANIQTWSYWGGDCQQWRFLKAGDGKYRIIARNSGLCMDVQDASQEDGANVMQYTCLDDGSADHQTFQLLDPGSAGSSSSSSSSGGGSSSSSSNSSSSSSGGCN